MQISLDLYTLDGKVVVTSLSTPTSHTKTNQIEESAIWKTKSCKQDDSDTLPLMYK
jgi:hypothetical protein